MEDALVAAAADADEAIVASDIGYEEEEEAKDVEALEEEEAEDEESRDARSSAARLALFQLTGLPPAPLFRFGICASPMRPLESDGESESPEQAPEQAHRRTGASRDRLFSMYVLAHVCSVCKYTILDNTLKYCFEREDGKKRKTKPYVYYGMRRSGCAG